MAVQHLRSSLRLAAATLAAVLGGCISKDATAPTALTLPTPLWSITTGAGIGRLFTESGGALLVGTVDSVRAINGASGSFRWGRGYGTLPIGGFTFDAGNNVAIFAGSTIQSIDMNAGTTLFTDPLSASSSLPSSDGTNLYIARTAPAYRIDQLSPTGVAGWSTPLATACPNGCRWAGTVVSGDTVFLAGSQIAPGNATQSLIMAFNRLTGAELWRKVDATVDTSMSFSPIVAGAQLVLVGTAGRTAWAINRSTKAQSWQRDELATPIAIRPVVAGNLVMLSSLFIGEAISADSGSTNWSVSSNVPIVNVAACPASVAWAATDGMIVVNRVTGVLIGGRNNITLGNGTGDIAVSGGRLYIATASGPTLAAYACP